MRSNTALIIVVCATFFVAAAAEGKALKGYCVFQPHSEWKPYEEIAKLVDKSGFTIINAKTKHGCWEVVVVDVHFNKRKIIYSPSGELLWMDND